MPLQTSLLITTEKDGKYRYLSLEILYLMDFLQIYSDNFTIAQKAEILQSSWLEAVMKDDTDTALI